jgi:MFS family permease
VLPESIRRQLGLVRRLPSFRLLFLATLGSGIGNWLAVVALTVDVYDRTGSGAWVSALWIANIVPAIAIGLFLGPLVDRLSRRWLMIGSDVARLGVFAVLPFLGSATAIVGAALVAGVANWFFRPAVYAGLPNLLPEGDLAAGNALLQATEWATTAAGPLIGGTLVAASGPDLAYWLNAVTFLYSAVLIARIPGRLLQSEKAISRGHWRDFAEGIGTVFASRALLTVLVVWSVVQVSTGWINVSEIVIAKDTFSSGAFGYGLLWATTGVGLAIGSMIGGDLIERRGPAFVYPLALVLMAAATLVVAVSPNVWVAAGAMAFSGVGNGAAFVTNVLLVQRGAPDAVRGRAFTVVMSTNFVVLSVAMVTAAPFMDATGPRWVWAACSAVVALAALIAVGMTRPLALVRRPEPAKA